MCLEETYMHFCKSLKSAIDNQKIIFYFLIKFVWYEDDFLLCKGMFISFENACWNKYMYRLKWFSKNEIKEVDVSPYSMIICEHKSGTHYHIQTYFYLTVYIIDR